MSQLVRDALQANLPAKARRSNTAMGVKYTFDCPACTSRGQTADKRGRGAIFFNNDGSTGYNCFNCALNTKHKPGQSLPKNLRALLGYLGMSDEAIDRLGYDVWAENKSKTATIPLPLNVQKIGWWIANPIPDQNLLDLLDNLNGMNPAIRDNYYWTPEAGESGDMNRRFIWNAEDPLEPDAWIAMAIDESNPLPIVGNEAAWARVAEKDR